MNLCAKRIGSLALAVLLAVQTLGTVPASAADTAEETETPKVVADWKFDQAHTTGSIADGSLIVEDQSGNDNDLRMETYGQGNWEDYLSFSDDSMTGQGGSMVFDGDNSAKTAPTSSLWTARPSTARSLPMVTPWSSSTTSPRTGPPPTSG